MKHFKLFFALLFAMNAPTAFPQTMTITFDRDKEGLVPHGFSTALTGRGKPGVWKVVKDETSPSKPNALAQTDMDNTDYRFPVCVYDSVSARNVYVCVRFKPVKGEVDASAGIVWRYRDKDNYYVVRANALEDNVVLYKVENGRRTDLALVGKGRTYGAKEKVPSGDWGTLRVVASGNHFDAYHNGRKLFEVEDETFTKAGKVGLWTKADSYTLFDDLIINVLGEKQ